MKLTTGLVRISYANLFTPKSINGSEPKYSVSLIIRKSDGKTVNRIKAALKQMLNDKATVDKMGGKTKGLHMPLRDGDADRDDEAYADSYFINANANESYPPKVLDKNLNEVIDKSEVYSGCYCQAVISFFPYNSNGNKGIGCGLLAIRKIKDGEPLSGATVVDTDFSDDLIDDGGTTSDDDLF